MGEGWQEALPPGIARAKRDAACCVWGPAQRVQSTEGPHN